MLIKRRDYWKRQPAYPVAVDRNKADQLGAIYLALANEPRICRDLIGGANLTNPGGADVGQGGRVWTFNGAQQGNLAFPLPSGETFPGNILIGARILASAAQAATPGQAFGVCVGSGTQSAIGVGFDSTGTKIGAAALTGNGAYLGTYSSSVINRFYDVFVHISSGFTVRAWIDGQPAVTGQSSSLLTGWNATGWNEIAIGAQHRSSGFLRQFKGAVQWASLIHVADPALITDDLVSDLHDQGFPYNLLKPRRDISFFLGAGAGSTLNAAASGSDTASGTATLAAQVALAAIGLSTATGNTTATVDVPLSAAGIAIADGAAGPTATISLTAAGLAAAAGQAGLTADILIAAVGAAQAAGNADLTATLEALAAGSAQSSGSASLSGGAAGDLNATGQAQANGSAALTITVQLAALGAAQSSGNATGQLLSSGQIAAAGQANAAGAALPTLTVDLAATGQAQAAGSATASLGNSGQITAFGQSQAAGNAELTVTAILTAAGFVQAMGAGALAIEIPLAAFGQAQSGGSANLTEVPDYIPIPPLRLVAAVTRATRLQTGAARPITLRHEVTRAS